MTPFTAALAPRAQTARMTTERPAWTAVQCRRLVRSCRLLWRWRWRQAQVAQRQ